MNSHFISRVPWDSGLATHYQIVLTADTEVVEWCQRAVLVAWKGRMLRKSVALWQVSVDCFGRWCKVDVASHCEKECSSTRVKCLEVIEMCSVPLEDLGAGRRCLGKDEKASGARRFKVCFHGTHCREILEQVKPVQHPHVHERRDGTVTSIARVNEKLLALDLKKFDVHGLPGVDILDLLKKLRSAVPTVEGTAAPSSSNAVVTLTKAKGLNAMGVQGKDGLEKCKGRARNLKDENSCWCQGHHKVSLSYPQVAQSLDIILLQAAPEREESWCIQLCDECPQGICKRSTVSAIGTIVLW